MSVFPCFSSFNLTFSYVRLIPLEEHTFLAGCQDSIVCTRTLATCDYALVILNLFALKKTLPFEETNVRDETKALGHSSYAMKKKGGHLLEKGIGPPPSFHVILEAVSGSNVLAICY